MIISKENLQKIKEPIILIRQIERLQNYVLEREKMNLKLIGSLSTQLDRAILENTDLSIENSNLRKALQESV